MAKRKRKSKDEPAAVPEEAAQDSQGPDEPGPDAPSPEGQAPPRQTGSVRGAPAGPPGSRVSCPVCDGTSEAAPEAGLSICGDCGSVFLGERPC